ncbi:hypothetical protein D0C16_04690 [Cellvibrio sp. KY-GH-1]|uniref:hypothetical protein n=1 Tax=Cellvibrio sp. KY-GH-1 TaxID=2303332 RepID=UPI001243A313|nr:hypothetical protein [Cellvibrio sp. KY-GH-1]QEY15333.1 hypothetical protein D0C16_04690 [Cellvibrio sp. KY-GH-1]
MKNIITVKDINFFGMKQLVVCQDSFILVKNSKRTKCVGYYTFCPRFCLKRNFYCLFVQNEQIYFILNDKLYNVDEDKIEVSINRKSALSFEFNVKKNESLIFSQRVVDFLMSKDDSLNSHFLIDVNFFLGSSVGRDSFKRLFQL